MGLTVSQDTFDGHMAQLFTDMPNVKVYIDDILVFSNGTYQVAMPREIVGNEGGRSERKFFREGLLASTFSDRRVIIFQKKRRSTSKYRTYLRL